jgi:hypothetical protein
MFLMNDAMSLAGRRTVMHNFNITPYENKATT